MPMNKQERHRAMRSLDASMTPSDAIISKRALNNIGNISERLRREVTQFSRVFSKLSPATELDKRTAFFDAISAETDGLLMLHDLGELFDATISVINDFRAPGAGIMTAPFTDANVTYYATNGVSD